MSLKTARIITVIIAVNILFALSSCARYNGDTTDGQSTMSSHANLIQLLLRIQKGFG